jgi:glycosyltransferase involved in cell wall biosynthesis
MKASILFIAYNQSRFIAEAIRSAMAQDHPDLELVVCDDASTDETRAILEEELTRCPPHVTVVRAHSEKNVGLLANFNRGMAACSGDIIVMMSGDDVSLPHRVSRIIEEFSSNPRCMLVYSNFERINDEGLLLDGSYKHLENKTFSYGPRASCVYAGGKGAGSTAAYRANVFKTFGPLNESKQPEDRPCWVRALLLGEIRYLAEPLVRWRTHSSNLSNYKGGTDSPAARSRILRDLLFRQNYGRQFKKDILHATREQLVSMKLADRLLSIIQIDRERERLRRFSLAESPWKLWQSSAYRLMKAPPFLGHFLRIIRGDFPIWVLSKKRDRHWRRKIRKGRD